MEIYNLHTWDIFLQGFFLLICLGLGVFIIFNDNLEPFKDVDRIEVFSRRLGVIFYRILNFRTVNPEKDIPNKTNDQTTKDTPDKKKNKDAPVPTANFSPYAYLGLIPIIIILSFIIGIVGKGVADEWIDSSNKNHLFLKSTWARSILDYDKKTKTLKYKDNEVILDTIYRQYLKDSLSLLKNDSTKVDSTINLKFLDRLDNLEYKNIVRKISFYRVFGKDSILKSKVNPRTINQLYYHAKHDIISKKNFYNYIRKSQSMSEYSRVFALGFFFLMTCGFLNFFIMIIRVWRNKFDEKKEDEITTVNNKETTEQAAEKGPQQEEKQGGFFNQIGRGYETVKGALTIEISTSLILIMIGFSWFIIEVFINPFFNYYLGNEILSNSFRIIVVVMITYTGILAFAILPFSKTFRRMKFSFFIYTILYVFSYSGYFISAKSWLISEMKVASKTFGVLKSTYATPNIKELDVAEKELKLEIFTKEVKPNKDKKQEEQTN